MIATIKTRFSLRLERTSDIGAREALLDEAFGPARFRKSSQILREGRLAAEQLSFVATEGPRIVGTARLWEIACGKGIRALLLGPVAVAGDRRNAGIGGALVKHAIATAQRLGHAAILLVGDAPYYSRFGFSADKTGELWMPGPFERHRLLGLELQPGSLDGARGMILAAGRLMSETRVAPSRRRSRPAPRAA